MKSIPKLIRRCIGILLLSCILLLLLNIALLALFAAKQEPNVYPWKTAEETAEALQKTGAGTYALPKQAALELKKSHAWAILIDNETLRVTWHTENLPKTVPASYTPSDIARLTRGYIDGYPTFTGESEHGLLVLGYPRDRFWKDMWPSWDYDTIANLPKTLLLALAVNAALIALIYIAANSRLLKSVQPIVSGIQSLPSGEPVYIREQGLLSELAVNINRTSDILQSQKKQLRRKETARANWIAGVSHDIRTPLSMVMGYAAQLKESADLTESQRKQASVILKQSRRMGNLINDLNLASKLEYNMQPLNPKDENLIALARQAAADFMNMDMDDRYPVEWETGDALTFCPVKADPDLIKRAIGNLIQNSINHNEQGCTIHIRVSAGDRTCRVTVSDDGAGAADEQLERLNNAPHYMVCDRETDGQRHGLGLLIVKQIAAAHGGTARVGHSSWGGFSAEISLPLQEPPLR